MDKLMSLLPGEAYVYFVGFLDAERSVRPDGEAAALADLAYDLYQEKKVHLTQRRLSPPLKYNGSEDWHGGVGQGFEYIATGAQPPRKPMITGQSVSYAKSKWLETIS